MNYERRNPAALCEKAFRYLLAFGTNLGERHINLDRGLAALQKNVTVLHTTERLETEPLQSEIYATAGQGPYINFVCEAVAPLSPHELYSVIQNIENDVGHSREGKWKPRELDIDILFAALNDADSFAGCSPVCLEGDNGLWIPHKEFRMRPFLVEMVCNGLGIADAALSSHEKSTKERPDMADSSRKKIVFLGTPQVVVQVLKLLLEKERHIQIVAAVTQPPARSARGKDLVPCPVHAAALEHGIPVLTPESARDPDFIATLQQLAPDLCVTAAYGNLLPDEFLVIPAYGTLNIHPSLLPLWRGAAPVQRSLEAGDETTGVSVAYTVKAMDAGPVLVQKLRQIDSHIKAPQLLAELFELGAKALIDSLPAVFAGRAKATPQNPDAVSRAKKITPEEGLLDFTQTALVLHNKVRAFAGWPGTRAQFVVDDLHMEVKVLTTRMGAKEPDPDAPDAPDASGGGLSFAHDALRVVCGNGGVLEILELQMPGKRAMAAKDFWNGLRNRKVTLT